MPRSTSTDTDCLSDTGLSRDPYSAACIMNTGSRRRLRRNGSCFCGPHRLVVVRQVVRRQLVKGAMQLDVAPAARGLIREARAHLYISTESTVYVSLV